MLKEKCWRNYHLTLVFDMGLWCFLSWGKWEKLSWSSWIPLSLILLFHKTDNLKVCLMIPSSLLTFAIMAFNFPSIPLVNFFSRIKTISSYSGASTVSPLEPGALIRHPRLRLCSASAGLTLLSKVTQSSSRIYLFLLSKVIKSVKRKVKCAR